MKNVHIPKRLMAPPVYMYIKGHSGADQLSNCVLTSKSFNCFGSLQMYWTDRHSLRPQTLPSLKHINTPGTRGLSAWSLKEWRSQLGAAANTKPTCQPVAVIPSASTLLSDPRSLYVIMMVHYLWLITNILNEIVGKNHLLLSVALFVAVCTDCLSGNYAAVAITHL